MSGDISTIALKAYSQGRERFQGATIDYLAMDEEPPFDVWTESLTRTNVTQGPCVLTFTPLKGVSSVVKQFLHEDSPDRTVVTMTLDDAAHYYRRGSRADISTISRTRTRYTNARHSSNGQWPGVPG